MDDDGVVDVDVRAGLESAAPLMLADSKSRRRALQPSAAPDGNQSGFGRGEGESGAGEASVMARVDLAAMPEEEE